MKSHLWIGAACAAALLSGCATRPASGPGSGRGETYVPVVQPHTVAPTQYEVDVTECQKTARAYTFVKPTEHQEALFLVNSAVVVGLAATISGAVPIMASEGVAAGHLYGFEQWVYSPQRQRFYERQESAIANCMTRRGYVNADPSVTVTWKPIPELVAAQARRTGRDTFNAERLAKLQRCTALPFANLVDKGPGYERYTVSCDNGRNLTVSCEFGACRAG